MCAPEKRQAACPKCSHPQSVEIWTSLNATLQPELREQVLSGSIFTLTCERCSAETTLEMPLLYTDPERGFMIGLDTAERPSVPPAETTDMDRPRLRRVETPAHLIEKIRIFEDELDDRLIEILKVLAGDLLRDELGETPLALLYDGLSDHPDGRQISFLAFLRKSVRKATYPYDELNEDGMRLLDALRGRWPVKKGHWHTVDAAATMRLLSSLDAPEARSESPQEA